MTSKVLHILTALSLFFSTTGLTVSFHYCADTFSGLALFQEASSCHDVASSCSTDTTCCASDKEKDDCCKTDTEFFKQDIEKYNTSIEFSDVEWPIAIETLIFAESDWTNIQSDPKFQYYRPPPLIKDIPVLYETFRC